MRILTTTSVFLQVSTDKVLKLKFGLNEKLFPMSLVSDAKAMEADVNQYVTAEKASRHRVMTKKEANKMRRQQDELVNNYTYTTADIEDNLRDRKRKGQSAANLGLEQTRAAIAVQGAKANLQDARYQLKNAADNKEVVGFEKAAKVAEKNLQKNLEAERMVKDKMKDRKRRLTGRSKDQKWAKVNERALAMNQRVDRGEFAEKEDVEASGAKPSFNPYARRKVKPKILWEVGQNDDTKEGEESKDAEASKEKKPTENENAGKEVEPTLVQEQQHKAAALNQSHQFAIDEEVLVQSSFTNGIAGLTAKTVKRARKGLSLKEYQERKEAGSL
jgi:RNA polymerase-associated protein RTF1